MRFGRSMLVLGMAAAAATAVGGTAEARKRKKEEPPAYTPQPTIFATPVSLLIASFDADGDARVTRAEYDGGVAREWVRADADGDGFLGAIEHGAWAERVLGSQGALPSVLELDRDGDDRVSREEFLASFDKRFATLDKDGDGVLVRAELVSFRLMAPPQPGARPPGAPGGPPDRP